MTSVDGAGSGFYVFNFEGTTDDFLRFSSTYGNPVPSRHSGKLVDVLRPTTAIDAHPHSLSARHGEGAFPFHTDGAYMKVPPRWLMLRLAAGSPSVRPTLIQRVPLEAFASDELSALKREVWLVNGGQGRFFTSIINDSQQSGSTILRYDPECMQPAHPGFTKSRGVMDAFLARNQPVEFRWRAGVALLIDNWAAVHARPASGTVDDSHRVLERVLIR